MSLNPVNFIAIIGASGCGKTTLLNYLSGYSNEDLEFEGDLLINNLPIPNLKSLKQITGYVLQEDILLPDLTVYETLFYQAKLKLPHGTNYEEKVNNVIELMILEKVKDSLIGDGIKRGLSGGERKRVSIACELITEPHLILLDEPTTGLDSDNAENVLNALKNLAEKGKLVATTIHQPSSEIVNMFDQVLI